jgi:hypothetical protein
MLIPLRAADTAFKQQRLKAWQPILTPKSVLPTLLIVGLIFAPIGGVLIWGSNQVRQNEKYWQWWAGQDPSHHMLRER